MDSFRSLLVLLTGMAIGGALVIAHRVSQETGKTIPESFAEVPAEAQRMFADLQARAEDAMDRARHAYEQKQAEMEAYLSGGGPAE